MAMFPHHSIRIATINPPANPFTNAGDARFKNNEVSLYSAYKRNLDSAIVLANGGKYHDAWILLNIAVECFFKHMYVLIRPEFLAHSPPVKKFPLGPWDYDGIFLFFHQSGKKGEHITMKDFGHEVMGLWQLIWIFTDLNQDTYLLNLKYHIPTQSTWVDARYEVPNHLAYKAKYTDYFISFQDCLSNTFGRFK